MTRHTQAETFRGRMGDPLDVPKKTRLLSMAFDRKGQVREASYHDMPLVLPEDMARAWQISKDGGHNLELADPKQRASYLP